MSKYFFRGESLNIVFATPTVEAPAVRQEITGYDIKATIQGQVPVIEAIDEYTFRLFLPEAKSEKLITTSCPIVIYMRKDGTTKIGRNSDLVCVDPKFALPVEELDDPGQMVLNMGVGAISFNLDLKQVPLSPFEMWLEDYPDGTQAEFLAFLQKPARDFAENFEEEVLGERELLNNKVSEMPAEPTGDEYPDLTLLKAELAKKPDIATPVPTSATASGKAGQIVIGGGFIYHCVADNTWERAALVTATWE